jgi:hypothetical protein
MNRRTTPPAPAVTLHAPTNRIESATDKDDRIRMQKLNDDDFKKRRDGKFPRSVVLAFLEYEILRQLIRPNLYVCLFVCVFVCDVFVCLSAFVPG